MRKILFLWLLALVGCSGEYIGLDDLKGTLSPRYNAPIGQVYMMLGDALENLDLGILSDSGSFYFEQKLDSAITIYADSLLPEIPPVIVSDSFQIGVLSIPDFTVANNMTLGQFGAAAGGTTNTLIQSLNGTTQVFPQMGPIYGGSYPMLGNSPICSAELLTGTAGLTILNGWPTSISVVLALTNTATGSQLATFNLTSIGPGQTVSQSKSLAGKTISSSLTLEIISMSTLGSGGQVVYINTSDAISMSMELSNIDVEEGSVLFPQSQLYAGQIGQLFPLLAGVNLSSVTIQSARLKYEILSPFSEIVQTSLTIPNSDDGFGEFGFQINSGPQLPDTGSVVLQNVKLDLTGNGNSNYLELGIDVSFLDISNCIGFQFDDDIRLEFSLKDIHLLGAEGFFGEYSFGIMDTMDLGVVAGFGSAQVFFFEPELSVDFTNSLGVPMFLDMDLTSLNSQGAFKETIEDFEIMYPIDQSYPRERSSTLGINPAPGVPFVEIPGNTFAFDILAKIVSTPTQSSNPNFILKNEDLNADIILLQKSKFALNDFVIDDTISLGQILDTTLAKSVLEASLKVLSLSDIPLELELILTFLDEFSIPIIADTLMIGQGLMELQLDFDPVEFQLIPLVRELIISINVKSMGFPNPVILRPNSFLELDLAFDAILNVDFGL